jgi:hypothetical protein
MTPEPRSQPFLQVIRGAPTEEEVAAATVVLLALTSGTAYGAAGGTASGAGGNGARTVGWTPAMGYCPPGAWTSR